MTLRMKRPREVKAANFGTQEVTAGSGKIIPGH